MKVLLGMVSGVLVLACCGGCQTANNNCSSQQGGVTNCGDGSTPSASSRPAVPPPIQGNAPASQYVGNLDPIADSGSLYTHARAEVNGQYYTNSIILYMNPGPASVEYNLGRHWQSLNMTLGLRDDSADNQPEQFRVLADGRIMYTRAFALGESQSVTINVMGILHLELENTLLSQHYVGPVYAVWGNAILSN
jgi:hypothetical protein